MSACRSRKTNAHHLTENPGQFGFMVPAGAPRANIDKGHVDTAKVPEAAGVKSRFEVLGMVPVGNSPTECAKTMREETERWAKIVCERKLEVD